MHDTALGIGSAAFTMLQRVTFANIVSHNLSCLSNIRDNKASVQKCIIMPIKLTYRNVLSFAILSSLYKISLTQNHVTVLRQMCAKCANVKLREGSSFERRNVISIQPQLSCQKGAVQRNLSNFRDEFIRERNVRLRERERERQRDRHNELYLAFSVILNYK